MSVQFGKCNFDGKPVNPEDLDEVRPVLASYGPDGEGYICKDNFGIIYRAFHTTKESPREIQPHLLASGAILTWDGRLDNREELVGRLGTDISRESTDLEIVAAAYQGWGTEAFAKLIGDWALSIWNPKDQSVLLAKDCIGTRHLYYTVEKDQVTWCTILDPLILFAGRSLELEEEYIAGWLACFPATHLTPYAGMYSVPPSSFVRFVKGQQKAATYWDFDPAHEIRYRKDLEYEEHFRFAFSESVRRRLRSAAPILAELSGGMDSSSIVCVADDIISRKQAETARLDTVSFYDDSEPNWNERPYFSRVEEKRGRVGCHIDISSQEPFKFEFSSGRFKANPGSTGNTDEIAHRFAQCLISQGRRVVLSGIGGDEVTGGVPTAVSELADLLVRGRLTALAHQLKTWALNKRIPWFYLFSDVLREFLPDTRRGRRQALRDLSWLRPEFVSRNSTALLGYPRRCHVFGPSPSFQENLKALDSLRRQIGCYALGSEPPYERRYPYLDRHLLEFLFALPREQLVRPGQRRSLMRRALRGIVPHELLERRRKAFVSRAPIAGLSRSREWQHVKESVQHMVSDSLAIVDSSSLLKVLREGQRGQEIPIVGLTRTSALKAWLRHLRERGMNVALANGRGSVDCWSAYRFLGREKLHVKGGENHEVFETGSHCCFVRTGLGARNSFQARAGPGGHQPSDHACVRS